MELKSDYKLIEDLLNSIVCKEAQKAYLASTDDSEYAYKLYYRAVTRKDTLKDYEITVLELSTLNPSLSIIILEGLISGIYLLKDYFTDEQLTTLLETKRSSRINEYEELNNYYRMLLGLPDKETKSADYVYFKGIPVHELPGDLLYEANTTGWLEVQINANPDKPYLEFINRRLDIVTIHEAEQFDMIWNDGLSSHKIYRECYIKERNVFMKTIHNQYLTTSTDYAEARELVSIKINAVLYSLILSNSVELDEIEYTEQEAINIWKEFGLPYPKRLFEDYRNSVTYLLNYLVSMKGTNKVLEYLSENIFSGINLYKYYIRKRPKPGIVYPVSDDADPTTLFDVDFLLVPFTATNIVDFTDIELEKSTLTYDEVVDMDPRWRDDIELKKYIYSLDFSYTESKYLSINNYINIMEFTHQFSTFARVLIEHHAILKKVEFYVPSSDLTTNLFNAFVYFLCLITKHFEKRISLSPDSLSTILKLNGFRIPPNMEEIRVRFAWFFARTEYSYLLDEFPDMLNDNDSFFNFVLHTEKLIGIETYIVDLLYSCRNYTEYVEVDTILKLIKHVSITPEAYDFEPTIEGETYLNWLLKNDTVLYSLFMNAYKDSNIFIEELDIMTNALISFFRNNVGEDIDLKNLTELGNTITVMTAGLSKYFLYILNLFKAYSADFLTTDNTYYFDERYDTLMQLITIDVEGEIRLDPFMHNDTQWDNIVIEYGDEEIMEMNVTQVDVILQSPTGSFKINV